MRLLSSGTNVDPADADYLKGRVRDKVGITPGTVYNEVLHGDVIEFFQKLVVDGSITENGLPDNVTNGHQLVEALVAKIDALNGGIRTKIIQIGDWDMDTLDTLTVAHGVTDAVDKIKSVDVSIINDGAISARDLNSQIVVASTVGDDGYTFWDGTNIDLRRKSAGLFDSASYSSTSFNRGWITIKYVL